MPSQEPLPIPEIKHRNRYRVALPVIGPIPEVFSRTALSVDPGPLIRESEAASLTFSKEKKIVPPFFDLEKISVFKTSRGDLHIEDRNEKAVMTEYAPKSAVILSKKEKRALSIFTSFLATKTPAIPSSPSFSIVKERSAKVFSQHEDMFDLRISNGGAVNSVQPTPSAESSALGFILIRPSIPPGPQISFEPITADPSIEAQISFSPESYLEASPGPTSDDAERNLPTPSPSQTRSGKENSNSANSEVFVEAGYLSKYKIHELVHLEHISAHALCPLNSTLPCGTSDHMLRVHGMPMSYYAYCQRSEVVCVGKQVKVNSVMSHLWKDANHSNGVLLTMLDSRHPEIVQRMLHRSIALVRWLTYFKRL